MCPDVGGVATLGNNTRIGPDGTICVELVLAVCLVIIFALSALEAGIALSTDTNTLALFDQGHLWSDTDCLSNNFCIRHQSIECVIASFCERTYRDRQQGGSAARPSLH